MWLMNGISLCALLHLNLELKGIVSRLVSEQEFYNAALKYSQLGPDECKASQLISVLQALFQFCQDSVLHRESIPAFFLLLF